jgi:hypothetical protein
MGMCRRCFFRYRCNYNRMDDPTCEAVEPYKKLKLADGSTRDEHRVMMERHLGRRLKTSEHVHHVNEIKTDNRIDNFEVKSKAEHARAHMLGKSLSKATRLKIAKAVSGTGNANAKLSSKKVKEIRRLLGIGVKGNRIAAMFGVSAKTISSINLKQTWAHV